MAVGTRRGTAAWQTAQQALDRSVDHGLLTGVICRHRLGQELGQALLVPDIELEGWWTSLDLEPAAIIALYADHGTSEQYHSEFKTDLDTERLPSGKFATNALVLTCATMAYNILRWIGQNGLTGLGAPLRHRAKRRRIKTVMQELMYLAARMIESGRRLKLALGRHCASVEVFQKLYVHLAYG